MNPGAELALQLLFGLIDRAAAISALLAKAQAEGRDILPSELDALAYADDLARSELIVAIARRRAQEAKTA